MQLKGEWKQPAEEVYHQAPLDLVRYARLEGISEENPRGAQKPLQSTRRAVWYARFRWPNPSDPPSIPLDPRGSEGTRRPSRNWSHARDRSLVLAPPSAAASSSTRPIGRSLLLEPPSSERDRQSNALAAPPPRKKKREESPRRRIFTTPPTPERQRPSSVIPDVIPILHLSIPSPANPRAGSSCSSSDTQRPWLDLNSSLHPSMRLPASMAIPFLS